MIFFSRLPHIIYAFNICQTKICDDIEFPFSNRQKRTVISGGRFYHVSLYDVIIFCDSVPTLKGCAIIMKIVALSDVFILSIHVYLSYYLDYIKGSC